MTDYQERGEHYRLYRGNVLHRSNSPINVLRDALHALEHPRKWTQGERASLCWTIQDITRRHTLIFDRHARAILRTETNPQEAP